MTLGLLDGRPLPRAALDHRLAALRNGPRATALPQPGSSEDRQLTRWVAQVLLTEALCEAVAAERDLPVAPDGPAHLDQQAAVELGSITAAAYEGNAAVRAVYDAVTADVDPSPEDIAHYRTLTTRPAAESWHLALPDGELEADPTTLPVALAEALRAAPPGEWVTTGPWTAALLATHTTPEGDDPTPTLAPPPADSIRPLARPRTRPTPHPGRGIGTPRRPRPTRQPPPPLRCTDAPAALVHRARRAGSNRADESIRRTSPIRRRPAA